MLSFPNPLHVGDVRVLSIDCAGLLAGDTFDADTPPTIEIANYAYSASPDVAPAHILMGSLQIEGSILKQKVAVDMVGTYVAILGIHTTDTAEAYVKRVLFTVEE